MSADLNPFAALLDPAAIFARCGALCALPLSAKRCADRQRATAGELARHDAEVEAVYQA